MPDILDRLNERCWPHDKRDELCMDAWYGKPVSDLSRSEVLMLVQQLANENVNLRRGLRSVDSLIEPLKRFLPGGKK